MYLLPLSLHSFPFQVNMSLFYFRFLSYYKFIYFIIVVIVVVIIMLTFLIVFINCSFSVLVLE